MFFFFARGTGRGRTKKEEEVFVNQLRIVGWGALLSTALFVSSASAQNYFRMGTVNGNPTPIGVPNSANPSAFSCFRVGGNSVLTQPSDTDTTGPHGCPFLQGSFQYWQVSPPTKSSGSPYSIGYWVGGEAKVDQSVCFTVWTYTNTGLDHMSSPTLCKVNTAFNSPVPGVQVPAYGATTIIGAFEVLAPFVVPQGTRWSEIAWPYN